MRYIALFIASVFPSLLMASPATDKYAPRTESERREAKIQGGVFGKAVYDTDSNHKKQNCIGVNVYLWRAALHSIHFLPKDILNPLAGILTTKWHIFPEAPQERMRLDVYILSQQLVSDGVKVTIFKEHKDAAGHWRAVSVDEKIAEKFEDSILTTARAMRVADERQ